MINVPFRNLGISIGGNHVYEKKLVDELQIGSHWLQTVSSLSDQKSPARCSHATPTESNKRSENIQECEGVMNTEGNFSLRNYFG
ncbi:sensor histidine kinase [Sesbania bispinosa]|nr:sensor histidine kinase [Sesbania bispinosa]